MRRLAYLVDSVDSDELLLPFELVLAAVQGGAETLSMFMLAEQRNQCKIVRSRTRDWLSCSNLVQSLASG